jgi:hypothetical protein
VSLTCTFCGEPIVPATAYQRVMGWERKATSASRKGGSDIALREQLQEFACPVCITRLRSGFPVEQESLV